jgi:MFS family permease
VAGIGGGGLVAMVWCIMGEIVPARDRSKWTDVLSTTWGCSALCGPLLGGVFSGLCFRLHSRRISASCIVRLQTRSAGGGVVRRRSFSGHLLQTNSLAPLDSLRERACRRDFRHHAVRFS